MTSREAFEAWADARDATHAGKLRSEIAGFDYPLGRVLDECWQAAIQHARDVAVKVCEEISDREHRAFKGHNPDAPQGKRGNPYVEGLSDGADLAADAIKEALK